jgi:hypothetical protein
VLVLLTVRLPKEIEEQLEGLSKQRKMTKSEIAKKAITEYITKNYSNPYETGKDLFGSDDSDICDGSTSYKNRFRSFIHEKHSH